MNAKKSVQLSMFSRGEDLPLFTGTAPQTQVQPYQKNTTPRPAPLPFTCHFCRDTGRLGEYAFCSCSIGQAARKARLKDNLIRDCAALSSGTIATLIGDNRYCAIEAVQNEFVTWVTSHPNYGNWQAAWEDFFPEHCAHVSLVTGYALVEGYGHYYFDTQLVTVDADSLDSIAERAYKKALRERFESGSYLPPRDQVSALEGVDLHMPFKVFAASLKK